MCSYKIIASEKQPPDPDYVDYNQFKSALVVIPRDFKASGKIFGGSKHVH